MSDFQPACAPPPDFRSDAGDREFRRFARRMLFYMGCVTAFFGMSCLVAPCTIKYDPNTGVFEYTRLPRESWPKTVRD